MATYVIGDIQGCFDTLQELLIEVSFSPKSDQVWIAGDLVNRGIGSLKALRWAKSLGVNSRMVLGNHEIHLLAVYFGIRSLRKADTIQEILAAPDVDELIGWLREKKLLYMAGDRLLVHAGFSPHWDLTQALNISSRIESLLQGKLCEDFLRYCFNRSLTPTKSNWPQLAEGLRVLTHIRSCKRDGTLNTEYSGGLDALPKPFHPWYEFAHNSFMDKQVFFGHWAAHGYKKIDSFTCLDSGCVWGGWLSAFRLEDAKVFHTRSVEQARVVNNAPL